MIYDRIDRNLDARFYAGEPIALELQLASPSGALENLEGRSFRLTVFRPDRTVVVSAAGTIIDGEDVHLAFCVPGSATGSLLRVLGLSYEIAEDLGAGSVDLIVSGSLTIHPSAAGPGAIESVPQVGGPVTRFVRTLATNRPRIVAMQRGARGLSLAEQLGVTPQALLAEQVLEPVAGAIAASEIARDAAQGVVDQETATLARIDAQEGHVIAKAGETSLYAAAAGAMANRFTSFDTGVAATGDNDDFTVVDQDAGCINVYRNGLSADAGDPLIQLPGVGSFARNDGSTMIGAALGGTVDDALKGRVSLEQCGAAGDAAGYEFGADATDDTAAIDWAIASGADVITLSKVYLDAGDRQISRRVRFEGPGRIVRKRGVDGMSLRFVPGAEGSSLSNLTVQGMNGSCFAEATGTTLTVTGDVVGFIRHLPPTQYLGDTGSLLDAPFLFWGSHIIDQVSGTPGGAGVYTMDRPAAINGASGVVRFTDAVTFNFVNDSIRVECGNVIADNITIDGSAGSGVKAQGAPGFSIRRLRAWRCHDHCLVGGNPGTDDFSADDIITMGTAKQNTIFLTANLASEKTNDFIERPKLSNVIALWAGDSALEFGTHVRDPQLTNATLGKSRKPALLWRDAIRPICTNIKFENLPYDQQAYDYTPFANVLQHEDADWPVNGTLSVFKSSPGPFKRGFAYTDTSDVTIEGGQNLEGGGYAADGSDHITPFLVMGNDVVGIRMRNNTGSGWADVIRANHASAHPTITNFVAEGNQFTHILCWLNGFQTTWITSRSIGNTIRTVRDMVYKGSDGTSQRQGSIPGLTLEDITDVDGFPGAEPLIFDPQDMPNRGYATSRNTRELIYPEVRYEATVIDRMADVGNKTVRVVVVGGNDDASFDTSLGGGTTTKRTGTAEWVGSAGAADFTGVAVYPVSGLLIAQRRGPDTGRPVGSRTFQRSIA